MGAILQKGFIAAVIVIGSTRRRAAGMQPQAGPG